MPGAWGSRSDETNISFKRVAKMTWLTKFWKKSQKHSSKRLTIYPTSYLD
jgi:hypothetical protein